MTARLRSSKRTPTSIDCGSTRTQRGFSLVQLLVVIAIMIVVAAVATPSFINVTRPMRLRDDAHALANLITMARMRASTQFAHTKVSCVTNVTPAYCQMMSYGFNGASWINEPQIIYLSQGVSFGIPATITTNVLNQSVAYQGDAAENTPTATTNPILLFNSRGLPIDPTGATTNPAYDYALYLQDAVNNYYAVTVTQTGHPTLYSWNPSSNAFTPLLEYQNGGVGQ